jgi:predicted permease
MNFLRALRNLFRKHQLDEDLSAELDSFRDLLSDEKAQAGLTPEQAKRAALLELGGAEQVKEAVRDVRSGAGLEGIGSEFRQTFRSLRHTPAVSLLSVGMLALGIGGSTVVFSIVYSALLRPLPFRDPDRLVEISETRLKRGVDHAAVSEANFWDVRALNHSFSEVAAYHYDDASLTGSGPAEKVQLREISAGFFRTLGVSPTLGRDFSYDDERGGWKTNVVLVGNKFWRTHFGTDPNILGQTLRLNDRAYTVVGVLPAGDPWLADELYIPFGYHADAERGSWEFSVIGRLKPGVTTEAAKADLARIADVLSHTYPEPDKDMGFRIDSSSTWIAPENTRRALWLLLGAVGLLLLIACVNVANLLLARGISRQREIAVRTALGASRSRLIRYVILESLLLSLSGAAVGMALAYFTLRSVQSLDTVGIPRLAEANLDPWVLLFAVSIALLTGVLSGLAPALQAPSTGIANALRDGDRQTGSRGQNRLRSTLVTAEVAISFLLLIGAGLLIRSFTQLTSTSMGFHTENRLLFSVSIPGSYWENGVGKQFIDSFLSRLSAAPGVVAAGAVNSRPVEGGDPGMTIDSNYRPPSSTGPSTPPWAGWRIVTPTYFRAAGLALLRGRIFDENDKPVWSDHGQPVPQRRVMLSARLAKLIFGSTDPIGKHVTLWKGQSDRDAEVVGVMADSRERGLTSEPALTVYIPYGRNALVSEFIVHTRGNPLALANTVRSIISNFDPNLPVADVRSFEEVVQRSMVPQLFNTALLSVFGCLALLLAVSGIYGVLSYAISRRTSEIGLRVALGASSSQILKMAMSEGMKPVLAGVALGIMGALGLSRYLAALLFGVTPSDLATYCAVSLLLIATALFACYVPGRRAMNTDPSTALRIE